MRATLHTALEGSLTALDAYLEALRPHEALLQRDEVAYVKAFADEGRVTYPEGCPPEGVPVEGAEPLTLQEIQKKVAEQHPNPYPYPYS